MKRLVLVDGHSLLHRAFHALPPLTTPEGEPIGAVYGFARMLLRVFEDLEPTYVGVAMDSKGPTFRHKEFTAYKEHRPETDEELVSQIDTARQLLEILGAPLYALSGYEGEDLIASLVEQAGQEIDEIVIITGDKDLFQLVGGKVRLFVPQGGLANGKYYGRKEVVERMGIEPRQVVDFKALCGDPSDNIPGVRGIGEKTAKDLLGAHHSLEEIYRHLSALPERTRKLLEEGKKEAFLSQKLARIVVDAPVELKIEKWKQGVARGEKAQSFFSKLGFKSLLAKEVGSKKMVDKQPRLL
jgi:DNA polymerase-1